MYINSWSFWFAFLFSIPELHAVVIYKHLRSSYKASYFGINIRPARLQTDLVSDPEIQTSNGHWCQNSCDGFSLNFSKVRKIIPGEVTETLKKEWKLKASKDI